MGPIVFVVIAVIVVAVVVWNFALRSHGDTLDLNNTVDTPVESAKEPVVETAPETTVVEPVAVEKTV